MDSTRFGSPGEFPQEFRILCCRYKRTFSDRSRVVQTTIGSFPHAVDRLCTRNSLLMELIK